jgi:glycosyltransferase involved in cell wall biosynthesis
MSHDAAMRIAEIAPVWLTVPPQGYGGIELIVSLLADGLVARGHNVTLFASGGSATSARLVSPLKEAPGIDGGLGSLDDEMFHALSAYEMADQFDVIHDHSLFGPGIAAVRGAGPPVVHTLHGPWTPAARRKYGMLRSKLQLVAISEAQRADNPDMPYAGVVHNAVDLDSYPFRAEKDDYLLFIGRSNPEKGPERAIEIARLAGRRLKMLVKRGEPAERQHWERAVEPSIIPTDEVFEHVSHEIKVNLLSRAAALVFPIQWSEPFGLVMIEAMACGTPVIVSPRGAAIEIVEHGKTGFLCESVEDMAAAVDRVGDLSPKDARDHVKRRFGPEQMVRGYERIFEQVVTPVAAEIAGS